MDPLKIVPSLCVVSWNGNRATANKSRFWEYFRGLDPDIALLQEVVEIPEDISREYEAISLPAVTDAGLDQKFRTWLLSKYPILGSAPLDSEVDWIQFELDHFRGNLVSGRVATPAGELNLLSVYSPWWPVDRDRVMNYDTGGVRLRHQRRDIWLADLLLAALQGRDFEREEWIVGGDFNLSETFDSWAGGPHGNKEYLDRMTDLGLTECLRTSQGRLTPTFRNCSNGKILHQMDHIWVSKGLADLLISCRTPEWTEVFDTGISDHLPLIADFGVA